VDAHERENETDMARTTAARLAAYERRYRKLLDELTKIGYIRSGSLAPRYNYCGKPSCRCHGDPPQPHGPYYQWTAKVNGKTVNRRLSANEAEIYQQWINNDRHLRAIIDELRAVASAATEIILEQARQNDVKV
jgi:hypothetical protein